VFQVLQERALRKNAEKTISSQADKIVEIENAKTRKEEELIAKISGLQDTNYALEFQVNIFICLYIIKRNYFNNN